MRTTINLDDDVLLFARSFARGRSISLGNALCELIRRGINADRSADDGGFPVFRVGPSARTITIEDVKRLEDEV